MSLTSFVQKADVKARLRQEFPKPTIPRRKDPPAPPLTQNYGIVGTAFDYLLRFYLQRLNPHAISRPWVAKDSLPRLRQQGGQRLYDQGYLILVQAQEAHAEYLETGEVTDELLRCVLRLGRLDAVFRTHQVEEDLQGTDDLDVQDLKNLLGLVDDNTFRTSEPMLLNPTFGLASRMVRGADADIILGDLLIDIKTVKMLALTGDDFHQLLGYYALSKIDKIDYAPPELEIRRIGIYFSRYGYLHVMPLEEVVDEAKFPLFLEWFEERMKV
ncbi:hypothetical protein [Coleofasciculus sp.]|uniref:hypothetical protein n=1 Tax=Coleofasciculus sp. TaxID=3100458 RepID=UPI003A4B2B4F